MLSTNLLKGTGLLLRKWTPRFGMNHIKNMHEENARVKAQEIQNQPAVTTNTKIYKPTYTIEFNREGQVLLYSANPINSHQLYLKYPYILYESIAPLLVLNYVLNPFDMVWYWTSFGLYSTIFWFTPRVWYFASFKYYPAKLFLLRGGRVLKVETQSVGADRFTYWAQNQFVKPLTQDKLHFDTDEAEFLTNQGQLKYDLTVELEEFKVFGVNTNYEQLHFGPFGTVHHPQLFEAAMKGYLIDTTDFVINTADNVRYREPNHNV